MSGPGPLALQGWWTDRPRGRVHSCEVGSLGFSCTELSMRDQGGSLLPSLLSVSKFHGLWGIMCWLLEI